MISKRLRFEILQRDGHTCRCCGKRPPEAILEVDHILPEALGGSTVAGNLETKCRDCNQGKASVPPNAPEIASVERDAVRWAAAIKQVAAARDVENAAAAPKVEAQVRAFDRYWIGFFSREHVVEFDAWRAEGWRRSIKQFLALGLSVAELKRLAFVAMENRALVNGKYWRYFCGCCWKSISELQAAARALLAESS